MHKIKKYKNLNLLYFYKYYDLLDKILTFIFIILNISVKVLFISNLVNFHFLCNICTLRELTAHDLHKGQILKLSKNKTKNEIKTNKSIVRHILVQIVNQNFECCENGFHGDD